MIDDRSSGWGSPIFAKSTAITGVDSQYVDNGLLSVTVTMKVTHKAVICSPFSELAALFRVQVLLPVAARAAAGDALLVPADSAPVAAGSHYLSNASDVLATAIKLAQADAGQGQPMRIAVPHTSQRQAHLFVAAIYARDMPGLLDSLPAARLQVEPAGISSQMPVPLCNLRLWPCCSAAEALHVVCLLQELSNVAHKLACSEVLTAVDEAMLRKCGVSAQPPVLQSGWLKPDNALAALGWAQSRGLTGLQLKAAQYAAAHQKELSLEGAASDAGENLVLMLRCLQGTA